MQVTHDPVAPAAEIINFDQFLAVDIRVGCVVAAAPIAEARKPAFKLLIDFGSVIGIKTSSAQITEYYTQEALVGLMVTAVVTGYDRDKLSPQSTVWWEPMA